MKKKFKFPSQPSANASAARMLRLFAAALDRNEVVDFDKVSHWYTVLNDMIDDDIFERITGPC